MRAASIEDYVRRVHPADRPRVRRVLDRAAHAQARAVFEHRWSQPGRAPAATVLLWCGPAGDRRGLAVPDGRREFETAADVAGTEVIAVLLDVDDAHRYHHGVDGYSVPALISEVAQLTAAVASRDIIGQAKGILMARHGCDADEAFTLLTDLSNRTNVPVHAVAERLASHKDPL